MRGTLLKAALVLLPALTSAFVVPNIDPALDRVGHVDDNSFRGPVGTVVEHSHSNNLLRFKIPCPDCSKDEKAAIEDAVLSLQISPSEKDVCSFESASGLQFNGEPLILGNVTQNPLRRSRRGTSKFPFPFASTDSEVHVHWENYCACLERDSEGQCKDYEYVLVLELPRFGRQDHPGFTISYKQFNKPQLIRLSGFPDKDGALHFGRSEHWRSPFLTDFVGQKTSEDPLIVQDPLSDLGQTLFSSRIIQDLPEIAANPSITASSIIDRILATPTLEPAIASSRDNSAAQHTASSGLTPGAVRLSQHAESRSSTWPFCQHPLISKLKTGFGKIEDKVLTASQTIFRTISSLGPHHSRFMCLRPKNESRSLEHHKLPWHDEVIAHDEIEAHELLSPVNTQATYSPVTSRSPHGASLLSQLDESQLQQALFIFCIVAIVLTFIVLSGFAFFIFRRDPRRRAERAARREERRNKRLFRKAVRRQKLRNFVNRFTGRGAGEPTEGKEVGDPNGVIRESLGIDWNKWTEKRLATLQRNDLQTHSSLHEELSAFRSAHRHVDGILCAEEGRYSGESSSGEASCGEGSGGRARDAPKRREPRRSRREMGYRAQQLYRERMRRRRCSDANSEKTAPPAYEEFEVAVVDGMQYVRQDPVGGMTPDSSVIATSTHASLVDSDEETESK